MCKLAFRQGPKNTKIDFSQDLKGKIEDSELMLMRGRFKIS